MKKLFALFCIEVFDAEGKYISSKKKKYCAFSILDHEHTSRSNGLFTKDMLK